MPAKLSAADRRIFLIAGGVFVFLLVATAFLGRNAGSQSDTPTSYSTGSGGAKAAYLLLKASGYQVERWEQSPTELPPGSGKTLILLEPSSAPTTEERNKLHQFVQDGGQAIVTGGLAALFLPESRIVPDPMQETLWKKLPALSPSAITEAAPEITSTAEAYWDPESFAVPLYGDQDKPAVVKYGYGKGQILWWAAATPATNAGLKEAGNLEFFLACLGGTRNSILWDEYFHGYRRSLAATVKNSPVKWALLQFGLLALAVLLTYSRRSEPICAPAREVRLSPMEFVHTLGFLYERADAAPVAVEIYHHRFRYWLTRRLGMASNVSVGELERAVRERWNFQDATFSATLRACESAPYQTDLKPRDALQLVNLLYDYAAKLKLFPTSSKEKD